VIDDSRVTLQIVASLTDIPGGIFDNHVFIVQATAALRFKFKLIGLCVIMVDKLGLYLDNIKTL
jgi:hypothetical protein